MNLKKLYTKCGEQSSPLSLFRKFDFFHTLCVIFVLSDNRKCMEEFNFTKAQQRTASTPDLVCSFFKLHFSKGKVTNIFNKQESVDFVLPYKLLIFLPPCPDYPSCRYNREGVCRCALARATKIS